MILSLPTPPCYHILGFSLHTCAEQSFSGHRFEDDTHLNFLPNKLFYNQQNVLSLKETSYVVDCGLLSITWKWRL